MNRKLNTGQGMPGIGLGTWQLSGNDARKSVSEALKLGYRLIDASHVYENESFVGAGIRDSGIPREDLFIVSKLENWQHDNPEVAIKQSLTDLGVDYLDLYLVHWPVSFETENGKPKLIDGRPVLREFDLVKVWQGMESLVDAGYTRAIGVCNFGITNMKSLLSFCRVQPAVLQIEFHPYLQQPELISYCRENNIEIMAYSPLGSSTGEGSVVREDPVIKEIAEKYGCSSSQVILSWIRKQGICPLPRSRNSSHLKMNLKIVDLSNDEVIRMNSLDRNIRSVDLPEYGPDRLL